MSRLLLFLTSALVLVTLTVARRLDDHELSSLTRRKVKDLHVKPVHLSRKQRPMNDLEKSELIGVLNRVAKWTPCGGTEPIQCPSGQCISEDWVCDGMDDCSDGSDEQGCDASSSTGPSQTSTAEPSATISVKPCSGWWKTFQCPNGECISPDWVCDGMDDCPSGFDEQGCDASPSASPGQTSTAEPSTTSSVKLCSGWWKTFQCPNGECISPDWVCDGMDDCPSGFDEQGCDASSSAGPSQTSTAEPSTTSSVEECGGLLPIKCPSGQCIRESWVCDGMDDCSDGSDEQGCDNSSSDGSGQTTTTKPSTTRGPDASSSAGPSQTSTAEPSTTSSVKPCSGWWETFQCPNGECISPDWVCDGMDDCPSGFDEQGCDGSSQTTKPSATRRPVKCSNRWWKTFQCPSGKCISPNLVCDGMDDCPSGFDEQGCDNSSRDGSSQTTRGPVSNSTHCGELPARDIVVPKRIVGGAETKAHDWPSICSLQKVGSNFHFCGATLVKNNKGKFFVISAAHCMWKCSKWSLFGSCIGEYVPKTKDDFAIVCGIHNIQKGDTPDYSQTLKAAQYINHENYDKDSFHSDITIIELEHQPSENQHVQAACLAATDHYPGEAAVVAGWGTLKYGGDSPDVLHDVYKPIDSDAYCEEMYWIDTDKDYNFCAGHREGGKDTCQGDSGGPLYTRRNNKWTLTGVVSYGRGCAIEDYVGVYADVNSLRAWIDSKINE